MNDTKVEAIVSKCRVIDVDSHWEVSKFPPGTHPLQPWLDRLPTGALDQIAYAMAGDLLKSLPYPRRPQARDLLSGLVSQARDRGGPPLLHPVHNSTAAERVAWMNSVGIDHCLVNPGGYFTFLDLIPEHRAAASARCNDFLADQLADHADRLHGVALVDLAEPESAADELERCRSRGHRAFFLYTVDGQPPASTPPGHPDWDVLWSAATDLGMVPVIHIGSTAAHFGRWADIGWDQPGGAGLSNLVRLANSKRIHAAQDLLSSMLFGGVFARHPALTTILAEMKLDWVPSFVEIWGRQCVPKPSFGDWTYETTGREMLERNVKVTPLPGFGDEDALDLLPNYPDMLLFSSDYPHQEGNPDPVNLYGPGLWDLDDELRERFLGRNAEEVFARMGNPL